jgi:prevent-host-death family protein
MVDLGNIRSLSEFQRNAKEHIKRLQQTGKPDVLTVNGEAAVVVQSAEAYQQLLDDAELARSVEVLRRRLRPAAGGRKDLPADEVLAELRKRLRLGERHEEV